MTGDVEFSCVGTRGEDLEFFLCGYWEQREVLAGRTTLRGLVGTHAELRTVDGLPPSPFDDREYGVDWVRARPGDRIERLFGYAEKEEARG